MTALTDTLARLLPRRSDYAGASRSWRADLVAGVTVGVVALPLALAFGISSGMTAESGLMTAIVAGFVAAVFGGSNVQVSGPTGAMTVVLVPVVSRHGVDGVLVVSILAGLLVVGAALLRLGRYLAFVPWPVVEGFTVGIAVIILLQQVPSALGVAKPHGENTAVVAARALRAGGFSAASLALVAAVAAIMVVLPRLRRGLPASLIAVTVTTAMAEVMHLDVARIGSLPSTLPLPSLPTMDLDRMSQLLSAAVAVAALAALESLLSAKVADGMYDGQAHDPDRELFGQGLANIASPLFGGMPATGAIARTAVNVRSGARTRLASMIHAAVLVVIVLIGSGLVERIPLPSLAGVLAVTAARMVEVHNVRAVVNATRSDALVFSLTALATVAFDLIVAVEIGLAAAAVLALRHVARTAGVTPTPLDSLDQGRSQSLLDLGILVYRLDGALFFGAAQRFLTELTAITDAKVMILRLPEIRVLDATGAQALGEIVAELEHRGITVLLKGPRPEHIRVLEATGALSRLAHANHIFSDLDAAVAHAESHATRQRTPVNA